MKDFIGNLWEGNVGLKWGLKEVKKKKIEKKKKDKCYAVAKNFNTEQRSWSFYHGTKFTA